VVNRIGFVRHVWFRVLLGGALLFGLLVGVAAVSNNSNLIPSVLLVGAFVVPVAFVVWVYERLPFEDVPLPTMGVIFLFGGGLGVVVAGFLEYETLRSLGLAALLGVGVIEESAKLLLPLVIYFQGRHRSEADGLLLGAASGMGFAALETMGYGLTAFIKSQGSVGALEQTLLIRGLVSPAGHAAWTGFLCAVIWRERGRVGHATINTAVLTAFITAVLLHTLWDTLGSVSTRTASVGFWADILGLLVVVVVSLTLFLRRLSEARRA
jgi:RsiW-degrading membrane proteinase PrsW (M82 family)